MDRRHVALLVAFVASLLGAPPSRAAGRTLTVPDALTPVLVGFVGDRTAPVKGTDGRWHVVYELWLTNARPVPATIARITVLDYDQQTRVLATLEGSALRDAMHDLATRPVTDASLAPNASKLVYVELTFDDPTRVPDAIVHRLEGTGAGSPAAQAPEPIAYLVAPWDIAEPTPLVLGPPLAGDGWVVANGCCSDRGAHRGAILPVDGRLRDAQRWAIDWMRLNADGQLLQGDPSKVESYFAYDQPLLAVADGTVVDVLDGLDDQAPGSLPDPKTITIANVDGNHVILDVGNGLYVFYAHMKKGTVRPKLGDRVRRGDEIGRLGNTGNTSAPHLHLHVMTAPSALAADGVPYVFERFVLRGALDAERWYDPKSTLDERWRLERGDGTGPRERELPLDLRVVDFPPRP